MENKAVPITLEEFFDTPPEHILSRGIPYQKGGKWFIDVVFNLEDKK
ncbi:MAG: hypothetical protein PHH24_03750 [Candidatus Moranbacteria bacterium]|jgi:hypothetical protein|nr:hypothetical protein [Candidatus Moranbacteria bacterium]MDD5652238.1 hypothetical protein [Candidatus Moranbacteria bacterium]MDX9856026.1 hypothetical protein [Candidatus Moranbacteria bacterium]